MPKETKKIRTKAKHPRRPVFDRALEDAKKKIARWYERQVKAQNTLVEASREIPRLEKIIAALSGESDVGRVEKPARVNAAEVMKNLGVSPISRERELLPDLNVAAPAEDDNRFLPDIK